MTSMTPATKSLTLLVASTRWKLNFAAWKMNVKNSLPLTKKLKLYVDKKNIPTLNLTFTVISHLINLLFFRAAKLKNNAPNALLLNSPHSAMKSRSVSKRKMKKLKLFG